MELQALCDCSLCRRFREFERLRPLLPEAEQAGFTKWFSDFHDDLEACGTELASYKIKRHPGIILMLTSPEMIESRSTLGEDLADAIASFHSSVWEQGGHADQRVLDRFGDWKVYEVFDEMFLLKGTYKALYAAHTPGFTQ
jgi:hypothetical protein